MNNKQTTTSQENGNQTLYQQYLHPIDLFDSRIDIWTCVSTRPHWEKRFTRWLMSENIHYFMPTYQKTTVSHRKKRTSTLPLFPSYVFVVGNHTKQDFTRSGAVVRVLKPRSDADNAGINDQLKSIWHMSTRGMQITPVVTPNAGQNIEILDGPLQGTIGRYIKQGRRNCLILEISMLETGVQVELPPECRFKII